MSGWLAMAATSRSRAASPCPGKRSAEQRCGVGHDSAAVHKARQSIRGLSRHHGTTQTRTEAGPVGVVQEERDAAVPDIGWGLRAHTVKSRESARYGLSGPVTIATTMRTHRLCPRAPGISGINNDPRSGRTTVVRFCVNGAGQTAFGNPLQVVGTCRRKYVPEVEGTVTLTLPVEL